MSTKVKEMKTSSLSKTMKKKELLTVSQGLAYINSKETRVWHTISQNLDNIATLVFQTNEAHKQLVEDLATKDEHGNAIRSEQNQIDFGDNLETANERWSAVLEEEVTFDLIPIKLEDLKDYGMDANIMKPLMGLLIIE
tara:strand:- start:11163 stop:11579 length:417 start_codon:yes stop_codon:yes gene_type:complete